MYKAYLEVQGLRWGTRLILMKGLDIVVWRPGNSNQLEYKGLTSAMLGLSGMGRLANRPIIPIPLNGWMVGFSRR